MNKTNFLQSLLTMITLSLLSTVSLAETQPVDEPSIYERMNQYVRMLTMNCEQAENSRTQTNESSQEPDDTCLVIDARAPIIRPNDI
jgi:hypothetical protein